MSQGHNDLKFHGPMVHRQQVSFGFELCCVEKVHTESYFLVPNQMFYQIFEY